MNSAFLAAIGSTLAAILAVAVVAIVLLARKYRLQPKNLRLPFMDLEASRFGDLSPVKLFENVSRAAISPSAAAMSWLQERIAAGAGAPPIPASITPLTLVHLGWHIVSNAFVARYLVYPSKESLTAQIGELGGQNIEFIAMYEAIYHHAIRNSEAITPAFARDYFLRAPSLATRISGKSQYESEGLFVLIASFLPDNG